MHISEGCPHPLGPSVVSASDTSNGDQLQSVNIAVLINVKNSSLCLFAPLRSSDPSFIRDIWRQVDFPGRTGTISHIRLDEVPRGTAYVICVPQSNGTHRLLTDPYAPCVESGGASSWMRIPGESFHGNSVPSVRNVREMQRSFDTLRALNVTSLFRPARFDDPAQHFDWQGHERAPPVPDEKLVVYEAHARALTPDGSLESAARRASYFRWLGVTAVQLMPIFEFAEAEVSATGGEESLLSLGNDRHDKNINRTCHGRKGNHWGYAPLSFFAPMNRFSSRRVAGGPHALKEFVRAMHAHGILVFLDVVYNHTANASCAFHFAGSQQEYYLQQPECRNRSNRSFNHVNYSGCGNTIGANKPRAQDLIILSMRHFATQYNIDGFRIDAAGILCRDAHTGKPITQSPILDRIATDPVLSSLHLIVEGWDAGDQIDSPNFLFGNFPHGNIFREWNPSWRDAVRAFWKGSISKSTDISKKHRKNTVRAFREALCGCPQLFGFGNRLHGVNFVACHDGLCMMDVVSYSRRVNTWDGYDEICFNCGIEGIIENEEDDGDDARKSAEAVNSRRLRILRNLFMSLAVSRGVPMFTQGDELAFSKNGHSNTWNDPKFYAAQLPDNPHLCVRGDALVQFVHYVFTLRANIPAFNSLDFGEDMTWLDEMGKPVLVSLSDSSSCDPASIPPSSEVDSHRRVYDVNNKSEINSNIKEIMESKFEEAANARPSFDNVKPSAANIVENDMEDDSEDPNLVAFIRPSLRTLQTMKSGCSVEALFVAFNGGSEQIDVALPDVQNMDKTGCITWKFHVDTYTPIWRQDTRQEWRGNDQVSLRAQSSIMFMGKVKG